MKKAILSLTLLFSFLFMVPATAYAESLCPGPFANLCKLKFEKGGAIFGPAVILFIIIAIVACLFFLILGGIKWTTSGGDQQKVAAARQTIIAALVGMIIALLAFFIVGIVLNFFGIGGFSALKMPKLVPN